MKELCLSLLLCLPLAAAAQQSPDPELEIYRLWNESVELFKQEGSFDHLG